MKDQDEYQNPNGKRNQPDEIKSQSEKRQDKRQRLTFPNSTEGNKDLVDGKDESNDTLSEKNQALELSADFDDDGDLDSYEEISLNKEELARETEELVQSQKDFLIRRSSDDNDLKEQRADGEENVNEETEHDIEDVENMVEQSELTKNTNGNDPLSGKMSLYNPRKWYDYCNCPGIMFAVARVAVCQDTKMTVNKNENANYGDIWQLMKKASVNIKGVPWFPDETDSYEFLHGCTRLGSCISAERLSVLLGGGYRSPEYCEYLLKSMLGIAKSIWKKSAGIEQNVKGQGDTHFDVEVNRDGLYHDDDELADSEKVERDQDQVNTKNAATVTDDCDGDTDDEENNEVGIKNNRNAAPSAVSSKKTTSYQKGTSYVLRNFLSTIADKDIPSLHDFQQHCKKLGIDFVETINNGRYEHPEERLKWLSEKFMTPELGEGKTMSTDPLLLWRNAEKNYSTKTMSRCALIQHDNLINWLNYASEETSGQRLTMDHLTPHTPVVTIAPIAMLYLADKAANFALKILTFAKRVAPEMQEINNEVYAIDEDDIWNGYRYLILVDKDVTSEIHMYCEESRQDNSKFGPWPTITSRPMTESADVLLCESPPASSFSIPKDVMEEMRSVVKLYNSQNNKLLQTFRLRSKNGRDENGRTKKMNRENEIEIIEERRKSPNYKESTRDKLLCYLEAPTVAQELLEINKQFARGNITDPKMLELHKKFFEKEPEPEDLDSSSLMWNSSVTVDARRLAWICLHALGKATETGAVNANHALGYGSTVNYTSFGDLAKDGLKGTISFSGLKFLVSLVDVLVRHEAEILMACAQHDDGRPWIDRADVVLVTSVRKEPFLYKDNL